MLVPAPPLPLAGAPAAPAPCELWLPPLEEPLPACASETPPVLGPPPSLALLHAESESDAGDAKTKKTNRDRALEPERDLDRRIMNSVLYVRNRWRTHGRNARQRTNWGARRQADRNFPTSMRKSTAPTWDWFPNELREPCLAPKKDDLHYGLVAPRSSAVAITSLSASSAARTVSCGFWLGKLPGENEATFKA
jgi:hypothetical protein